MLDNTTIFLFSEVPREIAPPFRKKIYNYDDLIANFALANTYEIFVSVYSYTRYTITIDKIFIDIDNGYTTEMYSRFQKACSILSDNNIPYIPVASGKKGFHLYIPLIPKTYTNFSDASNDLRDATHAIISLTNLYDTTFNEEKEESEVHLIPDNQIIGDIRRMTRLPNSIRSDNNRNSFCTYLPQEVYNISLQDVIKHIKRCNVYNYDLSNIPDIKDIQKFGIDYDLRSVRFNSDSAVIFDNLEKIDKDGIMLLIRPKIAQAISVPNPTHIARVASTVELIYLGFSNEEIINFYKGLSWIDFDESITSYFIDEIRSKNFKPYSNSKLNLL